MKRTAIHLETATHVMPREVDRLIFKTDHASCTDACWYWVHGKTDSYWRLVHTKSFHGYASKLAPVCEGCGERFRMRIPWLLFLEARLQ